MRFSSPLVPGTLIRRYKRFLAEVQLATGEILTVHCPNTGSMLSCSAPGSRVQLSCSANPKRKYAYTLELVEDQATWVGVNTMRTNKLVTEALHAGKITEFPQVSGVRPEVPTSGGNRLDLEIRTDAGPIFMEIKNCSLAVDGCAMFPDAVTARGTKHLHELMRLAALDRKTCIFFLVQRMDADRFAPADHIDPVYGRTLRQAVECGVMPLAYQAQVSPAGIEVVRSLPCRL